MQRQRVNNTTDADQKGARFAQSALSAAASVEQRPQRTIGNQVARYLIQAKLKTDQSSDLHEQEADRVAEEAMYSSGGVVSGLSGNPPKIQRKCAACAAGQGTCPKCAEEEDRIQLKSITSSSAPLIQGQSEEPVARTESPLSVLIAEDDAEQLQPGQMRKSEFLGQLHTSVCGAAEETLAGTMWSAMGCPYIDRWFSHYSGQSGQHVERALRRYAPETAGASNAQDYIPIITQRLRRGIEQWRETGEMTGVPEELAQGGMPGATAAGLMGGLVGGALSAVGSAISGLVSGAGRALSGLGRMLFKGREGGAREAESPAEIQAQLGSGRRLDGGVKAQMEGAYGMSFSGVRIHTDAKAHELSDNLNARAFTVGNDVAFGAGEYQPGTLIGDALIAHELAHVAQQSGASSNRAVLQKGEGGAGGLEEDADVSAVKAVASIWGEKDSRLESPTQRAMPRLRFGLGLQRCGKGPSAPGPNYSEDCTDKMKEKLSPANDLAQVWLGNAVIKIDKFLAGQLDGEDLKKMVSQLGIHFHIKDPAKSRDDVIKVRQGLAAIQKAFGGPVPFQCEKKGKGGAKKSKEGGCREGGTAVAEVPAFPTLKAAITVGDIHVFPEFFEDTFVSDLDPLVNEESVIGKDALEVRAAIVIHEMAHKYLHAEERAIHMGCKPKVYESLSTEDALDNADSYAKFTRFVQ